MESKLFAYMLARYKLPSRLVMKDFNTLYTNSKRKGRVPSNIHYLELLDEHPDSMDTMRHVAELLLEQAASVNQNGYIVLVGDGKTYEHLTKIKHLYGNLLEKLLIFPGDWHTLANFQPVLMKVYYAAGLKELALACGHRGETLSALARCSNFKRVHAFLVQAWQAIYRKMIECFCHAQPAYQEAFSDLQDALHNIEEVFTIIEPMTSTADKEFDKYIQLMSTRDDTWRFWAQFVFQDCLSYLALHLAIRCNNWNLRVSALKMMAPLFAAYDRKKYQQLVPHHLADIQNYPASVKRSLEAGAFAVSILGRRGHSVALDEAHEMCINKDMKHAVVRPTKAYLQKTSLFLRFRIKAYENLQCQLFPVNTEKKALYTGIYSENPEIVKAEDNIRAMMSILDEKELLPHSINTHNRGIVNVFSGQKATPEQTQDLLNFRKIGEKHLKHYIDWHILKNPSCKAPTRKHRLLTMEGQKVEGKRRLNQKERVKTGS